MRPALPASDYYGPSAPPPGYQQTACLPAATLDGRRGGDPGAVPTFTIDRSTGAVSSSSPAASPRLRRRPSPWPPVKGSLIPPGSRPSRRCHGRALLPGPPSTRLGPVVRLRGFHRWFLHSYTFPSRLPDPARLAVPDRPGVVRAAPARPRASGVRLLSASSGPLRRPAGGSLHPTRSSGASWRTGESDQTCDGWSGSDSGFALA